MTSEDLVVAVVATDEAKYKLCKTDDDPEWWRVNTQNGEQTGDAMTCVARYGGRELTAALDEILRLSLVAMGVK